MCRSDMTCHAHRAYMYMLMYEYDLCSSAAVLRVSCAGLMIHFDFEFDLLRFSTFACERFVHDVYLISARLSGHGSLCFRT